MNRDIVVGTGGAARAANCCEATVRNWEKTGVLVPFQKLSGGRRLYHLAEVLRVARERGR